MILKMTCQPLGFGYCIVEFPLGSLYYTTLLSNLNARRYIRGRKTDWNEYLSAPSEGDANPKTVSTGPIVLSTFDSAPGEGSTFGRQSNVGSVMVTKSVTEA